MFKVFSLIFFISCSSVVELDHAHKENVKSELIKRIEQREKVRSSVSNIIKNEEKKETGKESSKLLSNKNKTPEMKIAPIVKDVSKPKKEEKEQQVPWYLRELKKHLFKKSQADYRVSLLGVEMGDLKLRGRDNSSGYFEFFGQLKNKSIYKYLYSIDDLLVSHIDKKTMTPHLVNLEKNENGSSAISVQKTLEDKVLFFENVIKKGKKSSKERTVIHRGHFFDPLLFLRFIEITDVNKIKNKRLPVIFRGRDYEMEVIRVDLVEKKYGRKKISLHRIYFKTYKEGKNKKDQKIIIEKYVNGSKKIFSIKGKMKVGVLYGEIIE